MNRILVLIYIVIAFAVSAVAQSTPCTVKYPAALDDLDSLCRAKDNPQGTLAFTITAGATTFSTTVAVAAFPTTGLSLKIDNETILCTTRSGSTFSGCLRGQDGTTATTHVAGSAVRAPILSVHHNKQSEAVVAIEQKLGPGASPASSAGTGTCLIKQLDGTTVWTTCGGAGVSSFHSRIGAVTLQSSDLNGLNGSGLTGIASGTGGVTNVGSTTIGADTDADGSGIVSLQTRGVERARVENNGTVAVLNNLSVTGRVYSADIETPQKHGAICDGTSRALSTVYGSLAAAQAVYPFITSLTQQLDYAGLQKASYEALGYPTFEHADTNAILNKPIYIPAGTCQIGADIWLIRNASGVKIYGAGSRASRIYGSGASVFRTDGFWYSTVSNLNFTNTSPGTATMDVDGNTPGHPYATRGVQQLLFTDIHIDAGQSDYAFALTRLGQPPTGSGAQGSNVDFLNCKITNSTLAGFYSIGFNALQNHFYGGDFIQNRKDGIYLNGGKVDVYGTSFEATNNYDQIANGGYDINVGDAGNFDRTIVLGCRTESARFFRGSISNIGILIGNYQSYAGDVGWTATTAYTLNQTTIRTSATLGPQFYRVTTAGTSGASQPTWPDSGTVSDGTVVWTMLLVNVVDVSSTGSVELVGNNFEVNNYVAGTLQTKPTREVTANYTATLSDEVLIVDATAGNRTITIPAIPPKGKRYLIKKFDTSANTVAVQTAGGATPVDHNGTSVTLPGGKRGFVELVYAAGTALGQAYFIVDQSLDTIPQVSRLRANLGTSLVAGDFALSAGWGTTASAAMINGPKDARGTFTVTSNGTGQGASPTVTLTFKDGAWPSAPHAVVSRGGGTHQLTIPLRVTVTTTQLVITFLGTPVAGETYEISYIVMG